MHENRHGSGQHANSTSTKWKIVKYSSASTIMLAPSQNKLISDLFMKITCNIQLHHGLECHVIIPFTSMINTI